MAILLNLKKNTRKAKIKGDKIEVFKILNGYENIDCNIFFRN